MKVDPDSLVNHMGTIPSLPLIYDQLNEAINDPSSSSATIGEVISNDSGLAARLLKIANSALYNFPTPIDTITQAVTVIGIQQLRDLALGTSVVELFDGISDDLVNMDSFWKHSICCGITARILATYRRESNVERYFVAGLLHDIGRLVIYLKVPDQARETLLRCKSTHELLHKAEKEIMGFDHADVGGVLLSGWKLPVNLIEAVSFHHYPMKSVGYPTESSIVHVADILANAMQQGTSGERYVPPLAEKAWDQLGISTSILTPTIHEVDRQFKDVIGSFLQRAKA
jgi:HD-like signal output (HDOD) protein